MAGNEIKIGDGAMVMTLGLLDFEFEVYAHIVVIQHRDGTVQVGRVRNLTEGTTSMPHADVELFTAGTPQENRCAGIAYALYDAGYDFKRKR